MIRGEGKFGGMDLDVVEVGTSFDVYFHTDDVALTLDDDTVEATASPVMRLTQRGDDLVLERFVNFTKLESDEAQITLGEIETEARRAIASYRAQE
jgi:hypothetical protein